MSSLRLTPTNDHQRPTVVFLCGPHFQGALGVNCARQLSNHGTDVIVFAQVFQQTDQSLKNELKLLEFSSAKHVTKVKGICFFICISGIFMSVLYLTSRSR